MVPPSTSSGPYRSYGSLDDHYVDDADLGFMGVNQRLQLNQLRPGEVRESLNGRMDGFWKPRKSVSVVSPPLTTGILPLNLPFFILPRPYVFTVTAVEWTDTFITITTELPHDFTVDATELVILTGIVFGTTDLNGNREMTVVNATQLKFPTGTSTSAMLGSGPRISPQRPLGIFVSAASYADNLVTLTTGTHNLTEDTTEGAVIRGLTFTGTDYNGLVTLTVLNATQLTLAVVGVTGVTTTTTSRVLLAPQFITISAVSYAANVVTITTAFNHELEIGSSGNIVLSGIDFGTGTNYNGSRLMTAATANTLTFPTVGVTTATLQASPATNRITQLLVNDNAVGDVIASCLFSDPNSANDESVIVALTSGAKKINLSDYSVTDIKYPTGLTAGTASDMTQVFDRVFIFRDGQQAFEFIPSGREINAVSQTGSVVTVTVKNHGLAVGDTVTLSGLVGTSPPNATFVIVTVTNSDVFTVAVGNSQTTTFNVDSAIIKNDFSLVVGGEYPAGVQIHTVAGEFKFSDNIASVIEADNVKVGDIITVVDSSGSGLILGTEHVVSKKFVHDGSVVIPAGTSAFAITAGTGDYTGLDKVTISVSSTHGYEVGQPVSLTGITTSPANQSINGNRFVTGVVDSDTFEIHVDLANNTTLTANSASRASRVDGFQFIVAASSTSEYINDGGSLLATPVFKKKVSQGIGFSRMPAPPWSVMFNRRLWMPYYYEAKGSTMATSFPPRGVTDELIASDIIDSDTYDQIYNQYRITGGTADYVVGLHGFYDDTLLVFNRNSIHSIKGTQGSLADTVVTELTKEVGCLARKTIVTRGNAVLFLSDAGIYGLEFLNDYNLRGVEEPLSKIVQPYVDRINKNIADKAVAVIFDNRYYIALPLDSVAGAGDALGNNSILIFNFLNKGWESLDTYGNSRFGIKSFILGRSGVREALYAVSANGGLHQIDAADSSNDRLSLSNTSTEVETPTIVSSLTTRGYDLGSLDRKRFTDMQLQMQALAGENAEFDISFASEDPDDAVSIGSTSTFLGGILTPSGSGEQETASIRCRLGGVRGYTGTIKLERKIGSPKIHSIRLSGTVTNRQIVSQK